MRPSDWFLVELSADPTPGDAFGIRSLASKYGEIAQIAGEASSGVRHARNSGAASAWVGDAGDIFRDKSQRMPGELAKANDSYEMVAEALRTWAAAVDDTQAQADRGLQQAREAHADLTSAQAALNSAEWSWTTAHAQQLTYQKLVKQYNNVPVPANVTMPTDYQLRSTDRNAQHAHSSIAAANTRIADANARLAAAKALVASAKATRDHAERTAVHQITQAGDHAVKPSSIWEAIQDSAAWQAIVVVATVVLTIITIVAIFVGGPLVWALIIAATVLLMVNALMSIAQGKDAWGELILLGIGLIPGGRLLGLAAKGVEALARTGEAGLRIANGIRSVTGVVARVGSAVEGRVTTVLSTIQHAAEAAFPRVTPLVINGAKAAHSALDSFFNPSWLSHFHPGSGANVVNVATHHAGQAGEFGSDASHAGSGSHFETPAAGTHGEVPVGGHETGGAHDLSVSHDEGVSHDAGSLGQDGTSYPVHDGTPAHDGASSPSHDGASSDASGTGHDAGAGAPESSSTQGPRDPSVPGSGAPGGIETINEAPFGPRREWELVPGDAVLPPPGQVSPIAAARASQAGGVAPRYNADDFIDGHLDPGDRIEVGSNLKLPDNGHLDEDPNGPYTGYRPGDEKGSTITGFGFREGTAESVGFSRDGVWRGGQVEPHWDKGDRDYLVRFQATTRVETAEGFALKNTQFGDGGLPQLFVPDEVYHVHTGELIPVDAHDNPLPFRIEQHSVTGELRLLIYATRLDHLIHLH